MADIQGKALDDSVAIVGVACRFPGAPDMTAFEALLFEGRDAVGQVPQDRWVQQRYFHPDRGHRGKSYTFAAGTLDRVDAFDASFFGISPREAAQMDPQQRLLLELAHEAIEDGGIDGATLRGLPVGVYVGGSAWDYATRQSGDPAISDAYTMIGSTLCSLANRVSYAFDLRGPSLTMDTACSSSLVALHHACEAIRAGQVPMALVGGVSLLLAPYAFIGFSAASMLSPRGRCHAFDARADGYVRSEGGAVLVLRPLREALAAGDSIRAVVRGTGVNSDGRTAGFSLPNKAAQADLLRTVYGRFDLDPAELAYVEAHGTGTPAGDPIEAGALGEVLGRYRRAPLPIGSVKTNIGHLEAASGLAGLLKVVVALDRGVVPPSLHCETPNPAIPFAELNLQLVPAPLTLAEGRRLAGVNSFGFGGTNAHAVLEAAWPGFTDATEASEALLPPLLLSARSETALQGLAATWRDMLGGGTVDAALVRGAAVAREQHGRRLVVLGQAAQAEAALSDWLGGRGNHDAVAGTAVAGKVVFAFSGNGSQWAGMGLAAAEHNGDFRAALQEVDLVLAPLLGWSVAARLAEVDEPALSDTGIAQPLLFAVQVATVRALHAAGVSADACMGHSVGEVAAAWAAGCLTLPQACRVIAVRSRLQARTAGDGRMAVLGLPPERAAAILAGTEVELAAYNGSGAVTVAGPPAAIAALGAQAERERWAFTALDLDHAFHSASMDPIEAPLLAELGDLAPPPCAATFVSTVCGAALPDGQRLDAAYWWRNVRAPVRFAEAAAAAVADGGRIFVEIGPQPVLQAYVHDALRGVDADGRVVPTLTRRSPKARDVIAIAAARCHVAGCDIRGAAMFHGPHRHDALPRYPWQWESHWAGRSTESRDLASVPMGHPLLGGRPDTGADPAEWFNHLGPSLQTWLADHVVGGATVAPAAALVEMALAAARARYPAAEALDIRDLEISRPLTFDADGLREVRLKLTAVGQGGGFEIASRPRLCDDAWTLHATGRLAAAAATAPLRPGTAVPAGAGQTMDAAELYACAAGLGLQYGPAFQTVRAIRVARGEARAEVLLLPPEPGDGGMLLPPTLLDGAFQGLVALAQRLLAAGDGVLPWRFGQIRLHRAAGAVPASARLHVMRVGPRSVKADIVLCDAAGEVVAEALDCWFVRVALGAAAASPEALLFHTAEIASPDPRLAGAAGAMLAPALDAGADEATCLPHEAALFADAFVAAAMDETLHALLPDPESPFTVGALAETGRMAPSASPTVRQGLQWLEADGRAERVGAGWRLVPTDLPSADAILRTLTFDTPGAIADATLLAAWAEALPDRLRRGEGAAAMPAASLAEQVLHGSPAGVAASQALIGAVQRIVDLWPAGQPLRVLQLGAQRGGFSQALLRQLKRAGAEAVYLDVITEPADLPALAHALEGHPRTAALSALTDDGGYDLVVGFCAQSLGGVGVDQLAAAMRRAPGGLLLLLEPEPARSWTAMFPASGDRLQDGTGWCHVARAAGARTAEWRPVAESWPAALIAASVAPAMLDAVPCAAALVAESGDPLAQAVAQGLLDASATVRHRSVACDSDAEDGAAATDCVVLLPDRPSSLAVWLDRLARLAVPAARLTILLRGGPDSPAAAAAAGLRRVMQNERPDVVCRLVRFDPALAVAEAAGCAVAEILRPDAEAEIAWSHHGRTVPRIRQGLPPTAVHEAPAWRLAVGRPGLLDSLHWEAVSEPVLPSPGQLTLEVRAAGLNFRDVMWAMGLLPDEALLDGFAGPTLGLECAGVVTAVGEGVDGFAPGDRVAAFAPASMARHATTAAHAVLRIPDDMGFAAAATIPVAFLTVAYALGHLARLQPGERVLVHGGAGGVGLAAIQYARLCGAVVFATAGSPAKRALLRRLGVEAVFDSRSLAFADEVMRLTEGEGVDVVLNSLSGEAMEASLGLLRPFGRFLELGKRDFYGNTAVGLRPFRHNVAYFGVDADQLPLRRPALAAALFAEIAAAMRDGALRPLPYRAYDAAAAADAFRLMQASGHVGKIVLDLTAPPMVAAAKAAEAAVLQVDPGRTYLVTGGLAGFGLETARWLAGQGVRHLALLGRRGRETAGAVAALAALQADGVQAEAFACDVADEAALAAVLAQIRAAMPPLAGVVHAAVDMNDGLLAELDAARFDRSLRPKFAGAAALDRLTRGDALTLFVVFSSVTTVLGNPGQANYVAANAAAEAVVLRRHQDGLPALAVQWGPIGDAGYLARERGVAKLLSKQLGGSFLTAHDALAALPRLLAAGLPVVGMAEMRWSRLATSLNLLRSSLFEELRGGAAEPAAEVDLRALLENSPPEVAQAKLGEVLAEEVARIMKTAASSIELHRPLSELGMDSLMAVELRLAVEQRFGLSIPILAVSDGASLWALAGRMARAAGKKEASEERTRLADDLERFARFEPAIAAAEGAAS